jgi:lipopolysaccharide transport system permease protein
MRLTLLLQLTKRYILARYRGSMLGMVWSFLTPLTMLAIYTFLFTIVFKAKWGIDPAKEGTGSFAVILFTGLILHTFFVESLSRASSVVVDNVNFVKKVIFPLEILSPAILGAGLFQFGIGFIILFLASLAVFGIPPVTIFLVPVVLLPLVLLTLGLCWIVAALGVYFRDITQIINLMGTVLLFLSTIIIPPASLPEVLRPFIYLNPLSYPVDMLRDVTLWGKVPQMLPFMLYSTIAALTFMLGNWFFSRTRRGFADVL